MKLPLNFLSVCLIIGCNQQPRVPVLKVLNSPTTSLLQAISIVDQDVVWLSGHQASVALSMDQGNSWDLFQHPSVGTLQFRDIHAFDENRVILMSAGSGSLSRIFTFKKPNIWQENFVMTDSAGFLDCIDFWDDQNGIAYGDAIDNYPYILLTIDGGKSWHRADTLNMPFAGEGEGGFAASGTCVTTGENGYAWVATGAGGNARIFITKNYGRSWSVVESPLVRGEAAGNTSISMLGQIGFVTGGDLMKPNEYVGNCAYTFDGGSSWSLASQPQTKGAFYGGALIKGPGAYFTFACGPKGIDYSSDLGKSWQNIDTLNYWAIDFEGQTGYASGTQGKILKISLQ